MDKPPPSRAKNKITKISGDDNIWIDYVIYNLADAVVHTIRYLLTNEIIQPSHPFENSDFCEMERYKCIQTCNYWTNPVENIKHSTPKKSGFIDLDKLNIYKGNKAIHTVRT